MTHIFFYILEQHGIYIIYSGLPLRAVLYKQTVTSLIMKDAIAGKTATSREDLIFISRESCQVKCSGKK